MRELDLTNEKQATDGTQLALDRLIAEQGVRPIADLDEIAALWPADDDPDALMNFVLSERQARIQLKLEDQQAK